MKIQMKSKSTSIRYLSHIQNNSPCKTAYSFNRSSRFQKIRTYLLGTCRETPNKFYSLKDMQSKRSTSMGFGKKLTLENKNISAPGLYEIKSSFDARKNEKSRRSLFGECHNKIYERMIKNSRTPGPGSYNLTSSQRPHFYIGQKLQIARRQESQSTQLYDINDQLLQKSSKHPKQKSFKIHTEVGDRLSLKKYDNHRPGPGHYNISSGLTIQQIIRKNRMKSNFSRTNRVMPIRSGFSMGPGKYSVFSIFGAQQKNS